MNEMKITVRFKMMIKVQTGDARYRYKDSVTEMSTVSEVHLHQEVLLHFGINMKVVTHD